MKQGTQSQYTGTTQRDGVGREVGGVSGWGDTCVLHVNAWQQPPQYCKEIILQLK